MKNIIFTIIGMFIGLSQITAQELPLFTQYREFQSFINPGAIPVDYLSQTYEPKNSAGISYRNQWLGYAGGPTTMTARYEHFSENLNSVFGGNIIHDVTGRYGRTGAYGRYAYRMAFSKEGAVTIGAKFGVFQNRYDTSDGTLRDAGDVLGETNFSQFTPDFGLGVFFHQRFGDSDLVYGGLSVPQFANSTAGISENGGTDFLYEATHAFLTAGMYKGLGMESQFGDREMFIEPSVWVKYSQAAPIQTDLNLRVHLPELVWIGLGYGFAFEEKINGNFLHLEGGVVLDEAFGLLDQNIKLGVGYDNFFGNDGYAGFGSSFEINLSYSWK